MSGKCSGRQQVMRIGTEGLYLHLLVFQSYMNLHYIDPVSAAELHLTLHESGFDRLFFQRDRKDKFLTIAWNR